MPEDFTNFLRRLKYFDDVVVTYADEVFSAYNMEVTTDYFDGEYLVKILFDKGEPFKKTNCCEEFSEESN